MTQLTISSVVKEIAVIRIYARSAKMAHAKFVAVVQMRFVVILRTKHVT